VFADLGRLDHVWFLVVTCPGRTSRIAVEFLAMAEPINLNRARKAHAADQAKRQAAENRVTFGRTKAQKAASQLEAAKAKRALDQAKRED
jgi:hypothetical protein